jgi:dCMP deaminase
VANQKLEDQTYMHIARVAAERSHDPMFGVGCVIVSPDHQLTLGWNGTPEGMDNATREPKLEMTENGLYLRMVTKPIVIHAENNALSKFTASTASAAGSTLYTTLCCCLPCAIMAYRAKVRRVVYHEQYKNTDGLDFLRDRNIIVDRL